ncbi:MAG TPA: hypothetical protein VL156_19775 [Terriglobales bacterium]|jgi:hypothetical protein|nr:hypothetical protein [Terriglobales bacterium]
MSKRNRKCIFELSLVSVLAFALCAATVAQVSRTVPAPNPNITAPSPQRHQAPSQPQQQIPAARATQTIMRVPQNGTVDGYILWDTSLVQYNLSTPCQGLQVMVVDMGNNSQPTLATSNSSTPVWSAPQLNSATSNQNYSGPTSKGPWMVCHYSFGQLPEREALEVRANVIQSSAFSPQVTPAKVTGSTGTQFTIPPGNCNTRRARSTLSTILGSFIEFCGGQAFNVNIELFPAGMGSRGSLPPNNVVRNVTPVANSGGTMLKSSSSQTGMLSGAPQPGMLASGAAAAPAAVPSSIQTTSNANPGSAQTMSFQAGSPETAMARLPAGAVSTPPSSGSSPAAHANAGPPISTGIQTAIMCGQDSSFRILGVSGLSNNTFLPSGKYTISGCSFGNIANAKAPTPPRQQPQAVNPAPGAPKNAVYLIGDDFGFPIVVGTNINSWSDNSITVTFPSPSQFGPSYGSCCAVTLVVMRGDGTTTGHEGLYVQWPPMPPPQQPSCAQANAFLITGIAPTPIQPEGHYKVYGCGFGTPGIHIGSVFLSGGSTVAGTNFYVKSPIKIELWTDTEIDFTFTYSDLVANPSLPNDPYVGGSTLTVMRPTDGKSTQATVPFDYY